MDTGIHSLLLSDSGFATQAIYWEITAQYSDHLFGLHIPIARKKNYSGQRFILWNIYLSYACDKHVRRKRTNGYVFRIYLFSRINTVAFRNLMEIHRTKVYPDEEKKPDEVKIAKEIVIL